MATFIKHNNLFTHSYLLKNGPLVKDLAITVKKGRRKGGEKEGREGGKEGVKKKRREKGREEGTTKLQSFV